MLDNVNFFFLSTKNRIRAYSSISLMTYVLPFTSLFISLGFSFKNYFAPFASHSVLFCYRALLFIQEFFFCLIIFIFLGKERFLICNAWWKRFHIWKVWLDVFSDFEPHLVRYVELSLERESQLACWPNLSCVSFQTWIPTHFQKHSKRFLKFFFSWRNQLPICYLWEPLSAWLFLTIGVQHHGKPYISPVFLLNLLIFWVQQKTKLPNQSIFRYGKIFCSRLHTIMRA